MEIRVQGYENQLKLFLVLMVLFLVAVGVVSIHALYATRGLLLDEATGRITASTRAVQRELESSGLEGAALPARLRDLARAYSMTSLEIVDRQGLVVAGTQPWRTGVVDPVAARIEHHGLGGLGSGGVLIREPDHPGPDDEYGPDRGEVYVFVALSSDATGPLAILKAGHEILGVRTVNRQIRVLAWVQALAGLLMLVMVLLFVRWVLRPYRALKAAASRIDPDGPREGAGGVDDPEDLISSFTGVLDKLEDQARALDMMREAAERGEPAAVHEEVLNGLTSGVMIVAAGGRVTALNPAGEAILGRRREEVVDADYRVAFSRQAGLLDLIREGVESGRPHAREVVPFERGAMTAHLGVTVSTIPAAAPHGGGVFCLFSDLTEIRGLQERVRMKENLAGLGVLSAGIAHEFRNSLGAILGYAGLIGRAGADPDHQASHAAAIAREVRSIGRTVDDFLRYARPATLQASDWSPRHAIEDVAAEVSRACGRPEVEIRIEGEWPAVIRADEGLIRQAFQNLLRNAVEAIPTGQGRVVVTATPDPREGQVKIEVADSGPGIPEEILPKLFTPFVTGKDRGTGLGLALAQKAIVSHDGSIAARNDDGGGARFTILLPLLAADRGAHPAVEEARLNWGDR